jgi:hypothetical protein
VPEIGTFLIGLREGLEASLVVSILVAYMVKTGNRRGMVPMWAGIVAAILLSLAFAQGMQLISTGLQFRTQETFEGVAKDVSLDTSTKDKGGELGTVSRAQLTEVVSDFTTIVEDQTAIGFGSEEYLRKVLVAALGEDRYRPDDDVREVIVRAVDRRRALVLHVLDRQVEVARDALSGVHDQTAVVSRCEPLDDIVGNFDGEHSEHNEDERE